jgi:hypothetical protein
MAPFIVAYRNLFDDDDEPRPILEVDVLGLSGVTYRYIGLVDSGSDGTMFPYEYAAALGYDDDHLRQVSFNQVSGECTVFEGTAPCTGIVVGVPQVAVDINPHFVTDSKFIAWGRADFMSRFLTSFDEPRQRFMIDPHDDGLDPFAHLIE